MIDKKKLTELCENQLAETVERLKSDLEKLNMSSQEDTKSSAGDKYEISREMIQQERDKLNSNLQDMLKMHQSISSINTDENKDKVERGAVVETSALVYFISVPLGKMTVEGKSVFAISPLAPVAQNMLGKSTGDRFEINGLGQEILKVY